MVSGGRKVCPSIDSYTVLVFGVYQKDHIKIAFSTTKNVFLHDLKLPITINLVLRLIYCILPIRAFNNSIMNTKIHAMP